MPTCFVMQPFDGATFDRRYEEVFAPAIEAAQLEPYRVDRDPKVSIPIQDIESGIRDARVCLADITLDNPNVWFELGYAIACRKEVVLVCSSERTTKFPFDVQHRTIIRYTTGSISDFEKLKTEVTEKLRAYLQKADVLADVSQISHLTTSDGLEQYEVVALAALAQNLHHTEDWATSNQIARDMEASGFTRVACMIAIKSLMRRHYLSSDTFNDEDGGRFFAYSLTEDGWAWVLANLDKFVLKVPTKPADDDIPF